MPVGYNRDKINKAKAGKTGKVFSSGRLAGSSKPWNGKKRTIGGKASTSSVESGYSLYSTDSEDQVTYIHKGLDRCAALLQDILQNETSDLKVAPLNPGRANVTKSKGTLSKGESTKRKEFKKNGPAPCNSRVQKQIVSASKFKMPSGVAQPDVNKIGAELTIQQVAVPSNKHMSIMNQPDLSEVQTQMSLINSQAPRSASNGLPMQSYYAVMESGCQDAPKFNSRLPTSTPALSPHNAGQPLVIQSGMPCDLYNQTTSQGGMNFFPVYTSTTPSIQPVMTFASSGIPHTSLHTVAMPTLIQPLCGGDGVRNLINYGEQCLKEQDPLNCTQNHVTKMQNHKIELEQKAWQTQARVQESSESDQEGCDGTTSEDDLNSVDITPVRDTSCQTSFDRHLQVKMRSPDKITEKVGTVKNLLNELKIRVSNKDDSEIIRLIMELDESVSLMPTRVGGTNVQAEIAIGLQALRSENAQLRRRLRIVNQQLRERERAEKESRLTDCNFELISLQCMNTTLQAQLTESQKGLESLQRKNEELLSVIDEQSKSNKQLLQQMQEKEQDMFHNRQQCEMDANRVKMEVDEALAKMKSLQLKLDASEKENQIVGITLRQRDTEVSRLRDLTRTLQCSMAKLLSDLSIDCTKAKPETKLTRNLLDEYNQQLQEEPIMDKGINSVAMYLKNLDIDKACALRTVLQSGERPEFEPTVPVQTSTTIPMYSTNYALPKPLPGKQLNFPSPTKTVSDGRTLVGEESNLDETTYIPLVGSVSKLQNKPFERRNFIPSQASRDSKRFNIDNESSDANLYNRTAAPHSSRDMPEKAVNEQLPVSCKLKEIDATDCSSRMFFRATMPENDLIQMKPLDITGIGFTDNTSNLPKLNAHQHTSSPHERNGLLLNESRVSAVDSSFSTFDSRSVKSDWTMSSVSSFSSRDEQAFQNGLAALDANIARLQRSLQTDFLRR